MATGTGLPLQEKNPAIVQSGGAPATFNGGDGGASDWARIAAMGDKLQSQAGHALGLEVHQAQVGYLADQNVEIARKRIEMRDQFASNPDGFDAAWAGYTEGKVGQAEPWALPHIKKLLGTEGNAAYSAILGEKRAEDGRLDASRIGALATQTSSDVIGAAMAGTLGSPDGEIKIGKFRAVLDSAVTSRLMPKEKADLLFDDTMSKAQGEIAARDGVQVYREKGFDAAVDHLKKGILENETLSLKGESRYKAFNRGLSAVRLAAAQDKEDRGAIVESSKDLRARLASNQPVDEGEIRDHLKELQRTGAAAEFKRLSVDYAVTAATAPYRSGLSLKNFATAVASERVNVTAPKVDPAMQFFLGKGWSREQAAGIVGNLLQESGTLDPTQSHDSGTGIGIAGWRLERRKALEGFAAARGKSATDFETQLEFVDHELRTSEGAVGARLRQAKTAGQAAEAFISFERPAGWTPENPRAGHGFTNRVRNAQTLIGEKSDPTEFVGVPFAGEIAKRVQGQFVDQARKAWPDFKARIDQGKVLDQEDFTAVRYAAALSGDANWQKQVEDLSVANAIGKDARALPQGTQQAVVDQARSEIGITVAESLKKQFDRQLKMVKEDPVGFAVERFHAEPMPLDLSSPAAAKASIDARVTIARGVAVEQQTQPGNPFRPAETAALAGAIGGGDAKAASAAFDALAGLPDDFLTPALGNPEIKAAVTGAARSGDSARFNGAMQFMDRLWARSPETAKTLFGEDNIHALMTWQTNLRYMTPEQMAKDREKKALDPGVREQFKVLETAGKDIAQKVSFEDVVGKFDTSWWVTPGPIARAIGSQPLAPTDGLTRAAMLSDYQSIYARRYAETMGDKDAAAEQTMALLKTKWAASGVNGGRLMLNAPETLRDRSGNPVYPAVGGSWDWMTKQIEIDLAKELGPRGPIENAATPTLRSNNWDYTLVSDRRTQAEAQAGQPASYQVVVTDNNTGRQTVMPSRYAFDPTEAVAKGRVDFDVQRARQTAPYQSINGELRGMFDPKMAGRS
jgi:hypothetical protein